MTTEITFLNPDHETMKALGLHRPQTITFESRVDERKGRAAGDIVADLGALVDSVRNQQPTRSVRIVYFGKGRWFQVEASNNGVFAVRHGYAVGRFDFAEYRRRRHSRVLQHWFDERCE